MTLVVSAPGKIHLLGEHTVVYGYPALLAAVGKRLYVQIKKQEIRITNKKKLLIKSQCGDKLIQQAVFVFQRAFAMNELPSLDLTVTSTIPAGAGMGSSAALAAGVIGALMKCIKNIWNPVRINELAYEVEKITHGNPSGADNTAVVFGGLLWYRKEFEFLKSIWSLPITQYKIPHFALVDTGRPQESTKEMVTSVASAYNKNPQHMRSIFLDQEMQTKKLLLSLKEDDRENMFSAFRQGEQNLEKMGVVGRFTKKVIRDIESKKGVAKICGAGGKKKGSGILLCYHEDLSVIKKAATKFGLGFLQTTLGGEGIRIEQKMRTFKSL